MKFICSFIFQTAPSWSWSWYVREDKKKTGNHWLFLKRSSSQLNRVWLGWLFVGEFPLQSKSLEREIITRVPFNGVINLWDQRHLCSKKFKAKNKEAGGNKTVSGIFWRMSFQVECIWALCITLYGLSCKMSLVPRLWSCSWCLQKRFVRMWDSWEGWLHPWVLWLRSLTGHLLAGRVKTEIGGKGDSGVWVVLCWGHKQSFKSTSWERMWNGRWGLA